MKRGLDYGRVGNFLFSTGKTLGKYGIRLAGVRTFFLWDTHLWPGITSCSPYDTHIVLYAYTKDIMTGRSI